MNRLSHDWVMVFLGFGVRYRLVLVPFTIAPPVRRTNTNDKLIRLSKLHF